MHVPSAVARCDTGVNRRVKSAVDGPQMHLRVTGAGSALIGTDATTDRIEAPLRRLLNAPDLRRNAKRLATEIAGMSATEA